jgi:type IV pilus assembly protein PilW
MRRTSRFSPGQTRSFGQRGFTLVELLVSISIGMALVGALIVTYLGNAQSNRSVIALAQLGEDGQAALALMVQQLRQTDYNPRVGSPSAIRDLQVDGFALFGCDNGFQSVSGATGTLRCNSTSGPAAFSVTYVGDGFNTIPSADTPPKPSDCTGAGVSALADANGTYTVVQNRFYVHNGSLMCAGNGGATPYLTPQPFVENVEDMRLSFGVSAALSTSTVAAGYMSATEVGPQSGSAGVFADPDFIALTPMARWAKVMSVRICVVMRSPGVVLPASASAPQFYNDCYGTQVRTTDGKLRRAFAATVLLRNRVTSS